MRYLLRILSFDISFFFCINTQRPKLQIQFNFLLYAPFPIQPIVPDVLNHTKKGKKARKKNEIIFVSQFRSVFSDSHNLHLFRMYFRIDSILLHHFCHFLFFFFFFQLMLLFFIWSSLQLPSLQLGCSLGVLRYDGA